jgi:hypothetical protein
MGVNLGRYLVVPELLRRVLMNVNERRCPTQLSNSKTIGKKVVAFNQGQASQRSNSMSIYGAGLVCFFFSRGAVGNSQ